VAIVKIVLPESPVEHPGCVADLNMLAITVGRERTARAFASLLQRAGWRPERVVPTRASSWNRLREVLVSTHEYS
jgi:hypothetical protein